MREFYVRFVHETLGSLAAPEVRDDVLRSALRMATPSEVPDTSEGFVRFVRGPLRAAMLYALGAEITDSASAELEQHFQRISARPAAIASLGQRRSVGPGPATAPVSEDSQPPSQRRLPGDRGRTPPVDEGSARIGAVHLGKVAAQGARPKRPANLDATLPESSERPVSQRPQSQDYARGTAQALGMPGGLRSDAGAKPQVFVASQSQTFVTGLAQFLEPELVRVDDIMMLLRGLHHAGDARSVIVLDCRRPSIRPVALAALAEELPSRVRVVLWGAKTALRYQLAQLSPATTAWFNLSVDEDLESVALRCEALVS